MDNCGIYAIVCTKTWRSYVGQSVGIHKRTLSHLSELRRNNHTNKELQEDFNKFGEQYFFVETLESVEDKSLLIEREKYWQSFGYNLYNGPQTHLSIPNLTSKQIEYFWSFVDKGKEDECWEWTGRIENGGYGRIKLCQRQLTSHRVAYFLTNKKSDYNSLVRHKCNNKKCCNPNHLENGTIQDNNRDIFLSGNKGILTWEEVYKIREKFKENPNVTESEISEWYYQNIKPIYFKRSYLIKICMNIYWIDINYTPPIKTKRKINLEIAKEIRELHSLGISYSKINNILNSKYNLTLSQSTISHIINNKLYKENSSSPTLPS